MLGDDSVYVTEEENRLKITLDSADLTRFGLTYDTIDYEDQKTKDMLNDLLMGAEKMVGFSLNKQKLIIEVFPAPEDGCIIYFTLTESTDVKRVRLKNNRGKPKVFEFSSSENMLCALNKLSKSNLIFKKSELYELNGKYRLVVWERGNLAGSILREYGEEINIPCLAAAFVSEHGKLLSSPDAVGTVSAAFNSK